MSDLCHKRDRAMKTILLTKGHTALVDDQDYDYLMQWAWHLAAGQYAAHDSRNFNKDCGEYVYMHTVIADRMGLKDSQDVDHKDGNGLNNRRSNLRPSAHRLNLANRGPQHNNTSGFKGVTWDKNRGKWSASIKVKQKRINLGRFATKVAAAQAYNRAAKQHFGEFAYLNPL